MKTIVITGPSGSGKTILSNKLAKSLKDSVIVKTDSYYRDNLIIKLISIFINDVYDRFLSFKSKEIMKTIDSLFKNEKSINFYTYDFTKKISRKTTRKINHKENYRFLILEGIFSHRLDLNYNETINIICKEKKEICYQRRLKRDQTERGRNKKEINKKFNKSWNLYFQNLNKFSHIKNTITLNQSDKLSYKLLIRKIKKMN
tara:strand:+ start:3298 stop:3903 length:606 start_codon:yes stop_codon:yes gene_type:complete